MGARSFQVARRGSLLSRLGGRGVASAGGDDVFPVLEALFAVVLLTATADGPPVAPAPVPGDVAMPAPVSIGYAPGSYGEAFGLAAGGVLLADLFGWGTLWLADVTEEADLEGFLLGTLITVGGPGYFASQAADGVLQRRSRAGAWPVHLANVASAALAIGWSEQRGLSGGHTLLLLGALQVLLVPPVALFWSATSPIAVPAESDAVDEAGGAGVLRSPRFAAIPVPDPAMPPWHR